MIKLNPDKKFVKELREKIKENDGFCPCMFMKLESTKCPCLNFRINNICHCNLYINKEEENEIF